MTNGTIKRDKLSEEHFWVCDCPKCGEIIETFNDPMYGDWVLCEYCGAQLDLVD